MSRYSYELGSDGFDSPGSSIFGKPGFNFLPYGVHTPGSDSLMSTGSREILSASYMGYGSGWKLPDKLRIIKPLEGSLTLHIKQRFQSIFLYLSIQCIRRYSSNYPLWIVVFVSIQKWLGPTKKGKWYYTTTIPPMAWTTMHAYIIYG